MPRSAFVVVPAFLALLAGCGGSETKPLPETIVGTVKQQTTTAGPKLPEGKPDAGKSVFASAGCGGCHTLKDAGASGTVGPNLDEAKPDLTRIQTQVINGGGGMPPFKGQLSDQQIADVSAYVFQATHG